MNKLTSEELTAVVEVVQREIEVLQAPKRMGRISWPEISTLSKLITAQTTLEKMQEKEKELQLWKR
tara:strand:- start:65 stop:262 length:198 start_codon:yes stop_codon:yes gene_type:complete